MTDPIDALKEALRGIGLHEADIRLIIALATYMLKNQMALYDLKAVNAEKQSTIEFLRKELHDEQRKNADTPK